MKNNNLSQEYERLRERYGNHSRAADALGITPESYRRIRRTGLMTGSLNRLILLLSSDILPPVDLRDEMEKQPAQVKRQAI